MYFVTRNAVFFGEPVTYNETKISHNQIETQIDMTLLELTEKGMLLKIQSLISVFPEHSV